MVVPILEAGLPDATAGDRLACAFKILGADPASAVTSQAVTTAYVWSLCRVLEQPVVSEAGRPVFAHLGPSARVEAPSLPTLLSDIGRLIPKRLRNAARDHASNADGLDAALLSVPADSPD